MNPVLLILAVDVLLGFSAGWLWWGGRDAVAFAALVSLGAVALFQIALFCVTPAPGRTLRVEPGLRKPHVIQMSMQATVYVYWGLYWDEVGRHVPFLLAQLAFAYAVEMLMSWGRGRAWHAGFGPVPIVLSTNLFLWTRDEYALFQFGLILTAYLAKEFLTWNRDGRRRHIFNPSAFPIAVLALFLMATRHVPWTRGIDIVGSFEMAPSFYEVVFLVGLVVQLLFLVTWVSFGAVLSLTALYLLAQSLFGITLGPTPFDPSVFLGLTLLVTDPATSPPNKPGKFLFGIAYGSLVFFICIGLRAIQMPSYFDKIFPVPILNLLVPQFERWGARFPMLDRLPWLRDILKNRAAAVVIYAALFLAVLPALKKPVYGGWNPLPPPAIDFSPSISRKLVAAHLCRTEFPEVYRPFAFAAEARRYPTLRAIFRNTETGD